ncbi:SubName: Full=Uncharacterized protein {ECO:0000313/EMBL:CCA69313.1} [Serendipita indica DSM 11827]|nr:SubName: Full=Uncharacterized protein {ECO:0000313/EMBL:CCA69313.1} [Serendipita indica DSM 11827]
MPTISPSERTPAEIWHYILQFSIFVPIFFSIDPASHGIDALHKYGDDSLYWETERARNALRRVCRSWDAFLNRFARRLVRLVDVEHGHVPISALRNAIRIQTLACHCRKPRVDLHQPWPTLDYIRKDGTPEPWKLQILFGFWEDNTAHRNYFLYTTDSNTFASSTGLGAILGIRARRTTALTRTTSPSRYYRYLVLQVLRTIRPN